VGLVLDLREMRGPEDRIEQTYPAETFSASRSDDYAVAGSVALALRVRKDGEKCRISGNVRTVLSMSCGRCLERFEMPGNLTVDLLYLPDSANRGGEENEIAEEDLNIAFYRDNQIDLLQMVHEQCQLTLPMKPLCRDQCRGLCPACGANRNERSCGCDTTWRDPRFAALETFIGPRH
jgi:uncharacterized protein